MPKIVAQKNDWIKLGYKLFAEEGLSGIIIEKMAKQLNCNKSSFYWHFKTKKEFINELVDFWVVSETEQIITFINSEKDPKQRFETLISATFKKDPYLDFIFHLKRYSLKEKKIQSIIDKIDNQRISFVEETLEKLGLSKQESKIKAILFYKFLIGYHEMIRYKKQNKNYIDEVKREINQFIKY